MANLGTYYVGRILKLGTLDQEMVLEAIRNPVVVEFRGNAWTFTDISESELNGCKYIFGRLSKYNPEGEVGVVDEVTRSEKVQKERNLLDASSPFIYIPEHSGIAFLRVSGKIEPSIFARRFCEIVEARHRKFFVECKIELISDLKSFAAKLASLDGIYYIRAKVSPPNPLFGPLWKELKEYLQNRNTDKLLLTEDAPENETINTQLPELVSATSENESDEAFAASVSVSIGDAAILMSADGYGIGHIKGKREGEIIVIRTSESAINFSFEKVPDIQSLFEKVREILERIKNQRHMEHDE